MSITLPTIIGYSYQIPPVVPVERSPALHGDHRGSHGNTPFLKGNLKPRRGTGSASGPADLAAGDINNYRQNHPELMVRDLSCYVDEDVLRLVIKNRGINKWLRVRRLLIQLKSRWLDQLKMVHQARRLHKERGNHKDALYLQGYEAALTDCRQQVRALCHSPRDVDFPKSPRDFGIPCELPRSFPRRPHKKWFWFYDNAAGARDREAGAKVVGALIPSLHNYRQSCDHSFSTARRPNLQPLTPYIPLQGALGNEGALTGGTVDMYL